MKRSRPLGVTVLGIYIVLFGIVALMIALDHLQVWEGFIPGSPSNDISPLAIGSIYVIIGLSRLGVGVGVLNLKKASWKGAFIIISLGVLMDLLYGYSLNVFIGVIALLYLIYMKKHFRFY